MLVYADIRPKELNVNQFSGIRPTLLEYCEDNGYGENNYVLFLIKIHKLYLCLSMHLVIMHDDVALFLKCKHVDECSFFELML